MVADLLQGAVVLAVAPVPIVIIVENILGDQVVHMVVVVVVYTEHMSANPATAVEVQFVSFGQDAHEVSQVPV